MQDVIDSIGEEISFKKKDLFLELLSKCIRVDKSSTKESSSVYDNVLFDVNKLFKGFSPFINEHGKDKKYESGVEALSVICDKLGVEIEKSECFILFHIRDLGKFRMKESKLHDELKSLWGQYKHYKLEDRDFSYALKSLMRNRFINYRRGSLHLNPTVLIRYR